MALLIWVAVEIAIIGYSNEPPLQAIYLVMGVAISILAIGWLAEVWAGCVGRGTKPPGRELVSPN